MKKNVIIALFIMVVAFSVVAYTQMKSPVSGKEQSCINSDGTVGTSMCCKTTGDFPNTCLIGACGCSLENSHEVKICECPQDKCFNGDICS
jgi:hypothetical protein